MGLTEELSNEQIRLTAVLANVRMMVRIVLKRY